MRRTLTLLLVVCAPLAALAGAITGRPIAASEGAPDQPPVSAGAWNIDPSRSEVRFTVTKLGFSDVTGTFRESEGMIRYDPARPDASEIAWKVRAASVLTDASDRDSALRGEPYFHTARHPFLVFASRTVRVNDRGGLDVTGDITIRGVTRPLTVTVRPVATASGPAFETSFVVNRYDFGVVGGSVMGRLIGREIRVHLLAATTTSR